MLLSQISLSGEITILEYHESKLIKENQKYYPLHKAYCKEFDMEFGVEDATFDEDWNFLGHKYYSHSTQDIEFNRGDPAERMFGEDGALRFALITFHRRTITHIAQFIAKGYTDLIISIQPCTPHEDQHIYTSHKIKYNRFILYVGPFKSSFTATMFNYGWDCRILLECLVGVHSYKKAEIR